MCIAYNYFKNFLISSIALLIENDHRFSTFDPLYEVDALIMTFTVTRLSSDYTFFLKSAPAQFYLLE